jgi:hypothetical protein
LSGRFLLVPVLGLGLGLALGASPASAAFRQERFLIGGWLPGPSQDASTLLRLADTGLDYIHVHDPVAARARDLGARLDSLARARPGFRLQMIVHDRVPFDPAERIVDNADPKKNWPRLRRVLEPAAGLNRRSTLGWHLADEPQRREQLDRIGELSRRLRALPATADQLDYCNLLPTVDPATNADYARDFGSDPARAYAAYLRAYLSQFDDEPAPASVLSFDHYPFLRSPRPDAFWFLNLLLARDAAAAADRPAEGRFVPVWVIIQASSFRPSGRAFTRHLTPVMVRWQAWSAVAYGAKGIAYWTLSPAEDTKNRIGFGPGVFDGRGRATGLVPVVRQLNRELHALGPTLMELGAVGARHVSIAGQSGLAGERWTRANGGPNPLGPIAGVDPGSGRDDALVALLRHRRSGADYVFVFNKSVTAARSFRVRLAAAPSRVERIGRADGRTAVVARATATFATGSLPPGVGDLFRIVR